MLSPSILVPRFRPGSKLPYSIIIGENVDPFHGKGVLYLFFLALKGAGDRLRQCRHCTVLFVQARRNSNFAHHDVVCGACVPDDRKSEMRERRVDV